MRARLTSRVVGVGIAMLLAVTACGGDSEDAPTTTAAGAENTTLGETPTTEAAPDVTATEAEDDSGNGDGSVGLTSVCIDAAQAMAAAVSSYSTGIAGAAAGTVDDDQLQEVTDQLQAMADGAPDEIKADLEVIAAEIEAFYTAWADIGFTGGGAPTPDQIAQIEALEDAIDQEAFDAAADNIEAWFDANC